MASSVIFFEFGKKNNVCSMSANFLLSSNTIGHRISQQFFSIAMVRTFARKSMKYAGQKTGIAWENITS